MERDQALKFMHDLLRLMTQKNGSDLFITANYPPAIKIDGKVVPVSNQPLLPQPSRSPHASTVTVPVISGWIVQ